MSALLSPKPPGTQMRASGGQGFLKMLCPGKAGKRGDSRAVLSPKEKGVCRMICSAGVSIRFLWFLAVWIFAGAFSLEAGEKELRSLEKAAHAYPGLPGVETADAKIKPEAETKSVPQRSVEEIAAMVRPSLVKITQIGREGAYGVGSGFILGGGSLVATNKHVIGEARRLVVETSDGRSHEVAEVLAHDTRLDLAVLRLESGGLPSLELSDSERARQGEPIVAMGNPEGLAFSVVEGVISEPKRDVEGLSMLQVAVPIERGNSGGPLLDRSGRVLGVLTLKSARTENLGFAMPVNALRSLLEKPNPIPMERWLTIGVLNPRFWKTVFGARWTQRAGTVHVSEPGEGFGGRSLCLWQEEPPQEVFSAAVTVWMQDESGAAGLAFCADAERRHYGFYPSAGRLRLTRFDGPDVFSWKVLREMESDAYRPGDWNTLRVEVEGERIRCYVNEKQVMDLEDKGLRGGRAGLCKFRGTVASFKGFRAGDKEESVLREASDTVAVRETVQGLLEGGLAREKAVGRFLENPEGSRSELSEKVRALEKQMVLLREVESEVHRTAVRKALVEELSKPEVEADLLRCVLLLSKYDNPDLDLAVYESAVKQLVAELRGDPELVKGTSAAVRRICRFLFEENGFHGSRVDSDNRSNSYLNEVLDDREGLPISLSVLFMEVARLLGVERVVGIPLPGRFMVGYRESEQDPYALVDVYERGRFLSMEEGLSEWTQENEFGEETLAKFREPALKRDIVLRMVRNLMGPLMRSRGAAREALPYLDLLIALDPKPHRERLSRAMLRELQSDRRGAREDVRWLLEHLPDDPSGEKQAMLEQWLEKLAR